MKTIGLTGGIASGKSTVAQIIRDQGYPVLDADQIARQVVEPGRSEYQAVIHLFGPGILLPDYSLDRRKLAKLIFNDSQLRKKLESIVHPAVKAEIYREREQYRQNGASVLFVEVPLLYESGMENWFDAVWVVTLNPQLQQERLEQRDGLSAAEATQRLAAQWPLVEKVKRADLVIENSRDFTQLKKAVLESLYQFM
ncbi:MAG TPA: dephospho-CoA kinase [Bacillota bacterium]